MHGSRPVGARHAVPEARDHDNQSMWTEYSLADAYREKGVKCMRKTILNSEAGYTFIELLIAVTILALVVAPLLGLLVTGFSAINLAGRQTTAVNLCRAALESTKGLGYAAAYDLYVREGRSPLEEDAVAGFPHFRRLTEVEPVFLASGDAPLDLDLLLIRITVSSSGIGAGHSTTLESYLAER